MQNFIRNNEEITKRNKTLLQNKPVPKTAAEEQEQPPQGILNQKYKKLEIQSKNKTVLQIKPIARINTQNIQQCPPHKKKIKKKDKEDQKQIGRITKRWTIPEDKLYIKFLQENAHLFRYKSVRRVRQIFTLLSERMNGRRTPAQCKSHHQKMRNATAKGTIKQIITYIKQKNIARSEMLNNIQYVQKMQTKELYEIACVKLGGNFQIKVTLAMQMVQTW